MIEFEVEFDFFARHLGEESNATKQIPGVRTPGPGALLRFARHMTGWRYWI